MKEKLKEIRQVVIMLSPYLFTGLLILCVTMYNYTQRYVKQDNYAVRGIVFTNEIDLEKHKAIGKGNGLFGEYESYTRSDRNEFIKVYYK